MSDQTPETTALADAAERESPLALVLIGVVFAVLNGWFLYQAIVTLAYLPSAYEAAGEGDRIPWQVLIAGVVLPVVFLVGSGWVAWRYPVTTRVLVLAAGLAATAATSMALYALSAYQYTH